MAESMQYCTFYLDQVFFGIEVLKVQEVIRYQEMTRVPLAPAVITGLINLRGQIVTALDLRRRLGLPPPLENRPPMNVVVRTDEGAVSLLVDEIGDVMDVEEDRFERTPETVQPSVRHLIRGVYKMKSRLLLILDVEKVVAVHHDCFASL